MRKAYINRGFYGTLTQGENIPLIISLRPAQTGYNTKLEAVRTRTYQRVIALSETGKWQEAQKLENWMWSLKTCGMYN